VRLRAIVVAALLTGVASAQSLGDAALKERERREKLKQKGDRAAVVTNDELQANKGSVANDPNATPAAPREAQLAATKPGLEPDRKAGEEEWRRKMALAHERITKAQEQYDYWKGQYLAPNDYFVDQDGKKVVGSVESLRKVIAEAKAELEKANAALAALEEQARRENVPPGWLR
jgi:hypothetical protein